MSTERTTPGPKSSADPAFGADSSTDEDDSSPRVGRRSGPRFDCRRQRVTVRNDEHTPDEPEAPRPDGQLVELAGRRRVVPDELAVCVDRGARVLVFSDLRLTNPATDISREVCRSVARAIEECRGPGAIVFAGDMFDLRDGTDVEGALLAHPRLSAALAAFVAGAEHRLIVLPGVRDSALAHDPRAIDAVARARRRGRARLRARGRHRRREPARARRARSPARPVGRVHRSARSQRPPARAASRARDRPEPREREPTRTRGSPASTTSSTGARPARSSRRGSRTGACCAARAGSSFPPSWGWPCSGRSSSSPVAGRNGSPLARVIRLLGGGLTLELAVVGVVLVFTITQLQTRARQRLVVGAAAARQRRRARRSGHARGRGWRGTRHRRTPAAPSSPISAAARSTRTAGAAGRVVERVPRARRPAAGVRRRGCGARGSSSRRAPSCTRGSGTACAISRARRGWNAWPPASACGRRGRRGRSPSHPGTVTWPSAGDATAVRRRTRRIARDRDRVRRV